MQYLHHHWKSLLFRGIVSVLFGILALGWPGIGLQVIVLIFGFYSFFDGLIALGVGIPLKSGLLFFEGIIGVLVGLGIIFFTPQAVLAFIYVLGFWAILTGILEIAGAIELRKYITSEVWLFIGGCISLLFGLIVFINPIATSIALSWVIGIYALFFGGVIIALALRVRKLHYTHKNSTKTSQTVKKKKKK